MQESEGKEEGEEAGTGMGRAARRRMDQGSKKNTDGSKKSLTQVLH